MGKGDNVVIEIPAVPGRLPGAGCLVSAAPESRNVGLRHLYRHGFVQSDGWGGQGC